MLEKKSRILNKRITLICELFNISSRTTAGRKINKILNPAEYLFSLMSDDDLELYLNFYKNKSREINLKIKKKSRTNINMLSITASEQLISVVDINGVSYQTYRPLNKSDKQLIHNYEVELDQKHAKYEEYENEQDAIYDNFLQWVLEFEEKNGKLDQDHYRRTLSAYMREDEAELSNIMEEHELKKQNVKIIEDYSAYLFVQKTLKVIFDKLFREQILEQDIENNSDEQIIQNLIQNNITILRGFSIGYHLDLDLLTDMAKSEFTPRVTKYTRSQ